MKPLKIKVILGSTREGRFGDKPAFWIVDQVRMREGVEAELLDLRDYPMPFFNEALTPNAIKEPYGNEVVKKWTAKVAEADAFVVVTPEYNHGYPAVLKNAFDWVGKEWHKKAVGFVAYGSVGGARAVEQLRQVVAELQMASTRTAVHLPIAVYLSVAKEKAPVNPELFDPVVAAAGTMLDQLIWWGSALKTAREAAR